MIEYFWTNTQSLSKGFTTTYRCIRQLVDVYYTCDYPDLMRLSSQWKLLIFFLHYIYLLDINLWTNLVHKNMLNGQILPQSNIFVVGLVAILVSFSRGSIYLPKNRFSNVYFYMSNLKNSFEKTIKVSSISRGFGIGHIFGGWRW